MGELPERPKALSRQKSIISLLKSSREWTEGYFGKWRLHVNETQVGGGGRSSGPFLEIFGEFCWLLKGFNSVQVCDINNIPRQAKLYFLWHLAKGFDITKCYHFR